MGKSCYAIIENDIIEDREISDKALRIYIIISNYANNSKKYCFLNHNQIMNKCNVKKSQFYDILNVLIEKKYLTRIKKNNRVYLQPVINRTISRRSYGNRHHENRPLFDYDWLNERD